MPPDALVTHTRVFSRASEGGNPCPVVIDAVHMTAPQMRAVAHTFGQECGFVVSPPDAPVPSLRFFVPEHEMSMCVHATIALVARLADCGRLSGTSATVSTPVGRLETRWSASESSNHVEQVSVGQLDATFDDSNPTATQIAEVLGVSAADLDSTMGPIRSVSTSRPKLIVPIASEDQLHALTPHWSQMWDLCASFDTTGIYAVCQGAAPDEYHARQFPVRAGYPEDAATGVAAAAFAAHLTDLDRHAERKSIQIFQGEAMGHPSLLSASARWNGSEVTDVCVSGHVTTVASESIDLGDLANA